MLLSALALFKFLHTLFAARANLKVPYFGKAPGPYLKKTAQFVSYNEDTKH
ncbi:DUF4389 domain-containing protein [Psychromonas sp.]|uniref:DUF4389 domain-containing protein n=1 Tax=Psychromonas sp. TaxID=1884585 RepID=UPI0039E6AF74